MAADDGSGVEEDGIGADGVAAIIDGFVEIRERSVGVRVVEPVG